ncbi:MAG: hypothetical protein ACLP01_12325 [Solirubrobacteraceae bacterium]
MIRALREVRLSWPAFAVVAGASVLASVLVLGSALGRSAAQNAALAALHDRPVVYQLPGGQAGSGTDAAASHADGVDPGAASASAAAGASGSSGTDTGALADAGADSGGATDADSSDDTVTTSDTTTTSSTGTTGAGADNASSQAKLAHVFVIALSTPSYAAAFGSSSAAPYLRSLEAKGTLLSDYESLGGGELADEIAMISGQGPNADTRSGCETYSEFPPATAAKANGLVDGNGCVYPDTALTIGDQVTASGHVWKAYLAGMGATACLHPNSGAVDDVTLPGGQPGYDTRHNPFIYFHSLLDLGGCQSDDVDLGQLAHDLAKPSRTATYNYIAPGLCADAATSAGASESVAESTATAAASTSTPDVTTSTSSTTSSSMSSSSSTSTLISTSTSSTGAPTTAASPTSTATTSSTSAGAGACPAGTPVGIAAENAFLRSVVPEILDSAAYRQGGALVIAFAAVDGGSGPVRTGALVLPSRTRTATTISTSSNAYSLLRSVEDVLGYTPLAHAGAAGSFTAALAGR